MPKKVYKTIRDSKNIDLETDSVSIHTLIADLEKIVEDLENDGCCDIIFHSSDSSCYECGGYHEFFVTFERKETDTERDKRIENARRVRKENSKKRTEREKAEKKLLAELLEKHGIPENGTRKDNTL